MGDIGGGRAKQPSVELSLLLPQDTASIPVVRHVCAQALTDLGCLPECTEAVGLAVTEACANVVRHAGLGEGYTVSISITSAACEMRVVDSGGTFVAADAEASTRARAEDIMSESGRGLAIIRAMTDDLWLESSPEDGTLVRMTKRLTFDETSPARRLVVSEPDRLPMPSAVR